MARINLTPDIIGASFLTNFGSSNSDVVVAHIFNSLGSFLLSVNVDPSDWYIKNTYSDGSPTDGPSSATLIDVESVLTKAGYSSGTFNVKFHLVRRQIISIPISEVSTDFKELKISGKEIYEINDEPDNNFPYATRFFMLWSNIYRLHRTVGGDATNNIPTPYTIPLIVEEGDSDVSHVINMYADGDSAQEGNLYLKLLTPLKSEGTSLINISTLCSDIIDINIELKSPPRSEAFKLMRPNFDLTYDMAASSATVEKTWNQILGSNQDTSQQLISKYVSASYGEGIELNIDYRDFNNFIHYSSAEERLRNFHYKMTLLESYRSDIKDLNALSGAGSEATGNIQIKQRNIDSVLNGFDGYERFMYYTSGSGDDGNTKYESSTWPKYNNTKPYCNISSSDTVVKKWFGSADPASSFFGGQIYSASMHDRDNQDMLLKALPTFILDDIQNNTIFTYTHMLGQHYDILFNYVNNLTAIHSREEDPNQGAPKEMLYSIAQSLGTQLFNGNVNEDLWAYALGTNQNGTTLQTGLGTGSGSLQSISGKDRTTEIWNRLINNLPALLKSKGTERSVRALVNCYGIPSSILRIVEFGGPDLEGQNSQFAINRYANALRFSGTDRITHDWTKIDKHHPNSHLNLFPNTIEMRIKTSYKRNQVLWADTQSSRGLLLEHSSSAHLTYKVGKSPYGRLKYWASGSIEKNGQGGIVSCSTAWTPLYDGDWWNLMLRRTMPTGSGTPAHQKLQPVTFDIFAKKSADHSQGKITHAVSASTRTISGSVGPNHWIKASTQNQTIGYRPPQWDTINGCPTDIKAAWPEDYGFSGSMQEYRIWWNRLSTQAFDQHIQNPQSIVGNNYSSSYYDLVTRFRLGTDLKTYDHSSSGNRIISSSHPSAHKYMDWSTSGGLQYGFASGSAFTKYGNDYEDVEEVYYINMPSTVGNRPISNKIRIENNTLPKEISSEGEKYSILSRDSRKELSALDTAPMDTNKLGIYLSPTNDINIDIANSIGQTRLDQFVGDPRDQYKNKYTELENIRNEFFKNISGAKNLWDYVRQIEFFDGSLFKIINKFVPSKANELTGLLIEPTILERAKIEREQPILEEDLFKDPAVIKMDYNTTTPNDMFATASHAKIYGESIITSGSIKRMDQGDTIVYSFTSSNDVAYSVGSSGNAWDMSLVAIGPAHSRHGYNFREEGSRYPQTQFVTHKGTGGYTKGSSSIQLTPVNQRLAVQAIVSESRHSSIYEMKEYFYSSSISASRHLQYLDSSEWRGPYEYSRDPRMPFIKYSANGQFGNIYGSYRNQAYSSSVKMARTNIDDNVGCQALAFLGAKLSGIDFNIISPQTPDNSAVVSFFETNPNLLFSAPEAQAGKGEILLSGELPATETYQMGGTKGDIIPGSQFAGPQGQTNGYWYNNGYEMVWVTASPPNTSWKGK